MYLIHITNIYTIYIYFSLKNKKINKNWYIIILFCKYSYNSNKKRVSGTDPKPIVSDPKPEPKSTKYPLGIEFIYPKNPDPIGFYQNPNRISEVPALIRRSKRKRMMNDSVALH